MKKIYNIILALAGIVALTPATFAQTDEYDDVNGFGLNKTVTGPVDGKYTITLESFVKGTVTVTNKSLPADIVLVLDYSGSMTSNKYPTTSSSTTRLEALKSSVASFIDVIYDNDNYEIEKDDDGNEISRTKRESPLGNRIAVVVFSTNDNNTTRLVELTNVTNTDGSKNTTINKAVQDRNAKSGGTYSNLGMTYANQILAGISSTRKENSSRTVVLFTDGTPASNSWSESGTTNSATVADACIKQAYISKNTHDATVFSVGLLSGYSGETLTKIENYLSYTSSNYPNANGWYWAGSSTWNTDPGTKESDSYYKDAGDDLDGVFTSIADASGGSSIPVDAGAIVEVDVVSSSFTLPQGASADDITVNTYRCISKDTDGTLHFSSTADDKAYYSIVEEYEEGGETKTRVLNYSAVDINSGVTVDDTTYGKIEIKIDAEKNEIKTTGFDFAANYCGEHTGTTADGVAYNKIDGYKLVIKIPIEVSDNAVGGASVVTNEEGSGIWVNGVNVAPFKQPDVALPVNLWVMKTGLEPYENAKFTVERKLVSGGSWEPYTSFVLTGGLNEQTATAEDGNEYTGPMIKLLGLDSQYYYRVNEESWSWQYGSTSKTALTTESLKTNPVVIVNELKETTVLHAESKVANDFEKATAKTYSSKHYTAETE